MRDLREYQVSGRPFVAGRVPVDRIVDLRWVVLRQGLPREAACFPGDDHPTAFHFAALDGERVVSCATLHQEPWQEEPAYRLRGMATADGYRSLGLGGLLLRLAEEHVLGHTPIRLLWCNARTPALAFYERAGWEVRSDLFYIPTAGPHRNMTKRLSTRRG